MVFKPNGDVRMKPTYKRGQVIWASWKAITLYKGSGSLEPPSVFRTRIKRVLELDRGKPPSDLDAPYAFTGSEYPGTGYDLAFTEFDTFYIAWAMVMLDCGMKQADIVWLLRHIRADAIDEHEFIMSGPRADRQLRRANKDTDRPTFERNGNRYVDPRVFALIRKIGLVEVFPLLQKEPKQIPLFYPPEFCRGIEVYTALFKNFGISYHHVHVFELGHLAWAVNDFLAKAPEVRRGRP